MPEKSTHGKKKIRQLLPNFAVATTSIYRVYRYHYKYNKWYA